MRGKEKHIFADSRYRGAQQRDELKGVSADWYIAEQPSKVKKLKQHPRINKVAVKIEYLKASVPAFVDHTFRITKCHFGFKKARYVGMAKNDNKLAVLFALANI
ncbi:MAG: transposase, IS4 family [Osedax symbiont Rs2]|nr:MAG: transposase, IS4 family [Osedax symbiont Rs2]